MPKVIHFEIPATDPTRAGAFYKKVFDWKFSQYPGMDYWLVTAGEDKEQGINGAIAEKDKTHQATINAISISSFEDTAKKIKRGRRRSLRTQNACSERRIHDLL